MAARLIQRRQDQALADLGLTHAAVIALQGLTAGPLNQENLAAEIKVRSQSLGRVLARLEGEGLVTRTSSSRDRRSNDVALTDAGLDALAAAREVEKDALPPNLAEGAVLSRELARVISYFPGPHRARATGREKAATEAPIGADRPTATENPGATAAPGAAQQSADRAPDTTDFTEDS
jgi:DNA-binding MarR family transcriptional regulator